MKSFLLNSIGVFLLAISFAGCQKDQDRLMYQQDPRVYFTAATTAEYTFGVKPATLLVDTIYINVRIMGSATKAARTFNIVLDDSSTAKLGYHLAFGPMVIAADSFAKLLPVYLYRRPGLKDSVVTAYLKIGETADFKPGYGDVANAFVGPITKLQYKITLNDQLLKPSNWDTYWINSFGVYSRVKFQFLIQATGKISWTGSALPQDLNFLIQTAKYALYQYEQSKGPMLDELGNRVVFP